MANNFIDTTLVDKAIHFAVDAHKNTRRRGKDFPYVIHVLEAMEIVATITGDPELLAAAALHDTVEDTDVTVEQIREAFGDRVARLVETESDKAVAGVPESATWRARKQAAIDRLAAAPRDAQIVAMGDKLSNMRAIARDYHKQGDALWNLFHAPDGKPDHEWHYRGLARSLSPLRGTEAYTEFTHLLEDVFGAPKPELVDLSEWTVSGDGYTAVSYNHKDGKRMLKLYSDIVPEETIKREIDTVWNVLDLGIKTPPIYRLITDGQHLGTEYARIHPKKSFARIISEQPERLEQLTIEFAAMCKALHNTPCNTRRFPAATERFNRIIKESTHFNDSDKQRMLDFVKSVPERTTCLHGDMHIGNVILNTDTQEAWWIDIADFAWGDPLFDLGMFNMACNCNPEQITQFVFHMGNDRVRKVWQIFVKHYFGPGADMEEISRRIAPFTALYMVYYGDRDKMYPHMRRFIENAFQLPPAENI